MHSSLQLQSALHQPITSLLSLAIIGVFAALHHRHASYSDVGMSYDRVIGDKQFWRLGSSQLVHVEILHLVFNLSALWSIGIAEQALGKLYYLKQTALLFILSPLICLALYEVAIRFFKREHYRSVTAVGYSCVLFGWMTVMAVKQPGGITMLPIFGAANLPMWLTPFGSLIFTSLVIPKASFVGHLAGILAGYLISIPLFDYFPAWAAIGVLAVAAAAMVANYAAQHENAIRELRVPLISKLIGGGGASGDADVESGARSRLLGGN